MTGIQESISAYGRDTVKKDLLCGKCLEVIKLNHTVKKKETYTCQCGIVNDYYPETNLRDFNIKRQYTKRYPIVYWARKYGIPVNSCYMAFRRYKIGERIHSVGGAIGVTHREFLAGILVLRSGQKVVRNLILRDHLLTDAEIKTIF